MAARTTAHTGPARRERLGVRVSAEHKALIQRAARLSGRGLSDFMVTSLHEAAERVIRSHAVTTLTARGSEAIAAAFLASPDPNDALLAAYERYRRHVREE